MTQDDICSCGHLVAYHGNSASTVNGACTAPDCPCIGAHFAGPETPSPAQREKEQQWQPIETAPRDETEVLLYAAAGVFSDTGLGYWDGKMWSCGWNKEFRNPTHWMPLPTPPALQSGGSNAK